MASVPKSARYGPTLDRYLDKESLQLQKSTPHSGPAFPSREEIRQAILQLSEPEKVTYLTFETILSLENTEVCNNLDLLLSDSARASLPACLRLVSAYCQDGRLIFDQAYGFLCVKVIALFVQVAMLSRSGYINGLVELLTLGHAERSIFSAFTTTMYSMMVDLMDNHLDSGPNARHDIFGWQNGAKMCLPEIGGLTTGQIQLLLGQLWDSRAGFVSCGARGRAVLFPGFGGFLCWIWSGIAQQYGLPGERQNPTPAWTQLVDLSIRLTLYCDNQEADLVSFVLLACPGYARNEHILNRLNSSSDAHDAKQIATMTPIKIRSHKDLPLRVVTTLFCFACPSVDYQENISDIFGAKIERLWFELDRVHNPHQLVIEGKDLPLFCQDFLHILTAMQDRHPRTFLRLLSDIGEDLYEALGRILLLPVSPSGLFKTGRLLEDLRWLIHIEDANKRTGYYPEILITPNVRHLLA
ncbi:unnamed protein product [Rhizoctonia solani]|uniref:Uncharacterized protein n=1 Tax=Rhizoctonia solani TaxID=456999 RepID=A0A8H3BLB2_9AGAM|nr:unnamed protein product [Rhizoctonia solani]